MVYLVILIALVSFCVTFYLVPKFIKYLKFIGLEVKDMNKSKKPLIPISGGLPVLMGILSSLLVFVFFEVFFLSEYGFVQNNLVVLFASLLSIFVIVFVGFLDDLWIKSDKSESKGFKQWQKPILTLLAAIPLMVINLGEHSMVLPFLGSVDFGWIYPLILIPLGVVFASNMVNMLAGLNGLESGLGLIYMGMLGIYAYFNQSYLAALIALVTFMALLAFFYYNKVPAKIFPGDSLTYLLGGLLAVIAIVGNMEKAVIVISIPFIVEFFLKLKGKFNKNSYGYEKKGKIYSFYDKKVYSLTHVFMGKGLSERQITYCLMFVQLVFACLIWVV